MIELATAIKEVAETSKMLSRLMPDYFKELPSAIGENIYDVVDLSEKKMLSMEEKLKIKEESDWSDEIVDQIKSMEEYEIYKQADVHEKIVDGRPCLCKDIDMDLKYMDPKTGETQISGTETDRFHRRPTGIGAPSVNGSGRFKAHPE